MDRKNREEIVSSFFLDGTDQEQSADQEIQISQIDEDIESLRGEILSIQKKSKVLKIVYIISKSLLSYQMKISVVSIFLRVNIRSKNSQVNFKKKYIFYFNLYGTAL
jgi:hypothetical protein